MCKQSVPLKYKEFLNQALCIFMYLCEAMCSAVDYKEGNWTPHAKS